MALAHRGGAGTGKNVGVENTLAAFTDAHERGYRHLETDVRCSADGVVFTLHDESLQRVAGRAAGVHDLSASDLDQVLIGGRETPPRLAEVYHRFPDTVLNIDVKSDDAVQPTVSAIMAAGAVGRTCMASFSHRRLTRIRRLLPEVATSASSLEVALIKLVPAPLLRLGRLRADCLQVPARQGALTVVTRRFLARAHALGLPVHVWTVDDPAEMHRLLDLGVDGLVTDRTDLLATVLADRGTPLKESPR